MGEGVIDNVAAQRLEMQLSGGLAFIDYRRDGQTLYFNHAEVPAVLNGRGVGSQLVAAALQLVRSRNERVVPVCSFVRAFFQRHAEYADLLGATGGGAR